MKKYTIAFLLILFMALACSLDSWGGCPDCESYGFYSGKMEDLIKKKVNIIPGFSVRCGPYGDSAYGYSGCVLWFPESPNMMRAIHAAQNITDILASMLYREIPVNMSLQASIGSVRGDVLIYKIDYNAQYDVWTTAYRFP